MDTLLEYQMETESNFIINQQGFSCFGPKKPNLHKINLRNNAITIRIAGIDAPEMGHFGQPEQPFAREAIKHLETNYLLKKCRIKLFRIDQYGRAVASVHLKPHWWSSWRDIGKEMLELGLACVYRGQGAEYGGQQAEYEAAEVVAKYE